MSQRGMTPVRIVDILHSGQGEKMQNERDHGLHLIGREYTLTKAACALCIYDVKESVKARFKDGKWGAQMMIH